MRFKEIAISIWRRVPAFRGWAVPGWLLLAFPVIRSIWHVFDALSTMDFLLAVGPRLSWVLELASSVWSAPGTGVVAAFAGVAILALAPRAPLRAPGTRTEAWPRRRLEHDGVLWEDTGKSWATFPYDPVVNGPFCPGDLATLRYVEKDGRESRAAHFADRIGRGLGTLLCPECASPYLLGGANSSKSVETARGEVVARFAGIRRSQETSSL